MFAGDGAGHRGSRRSWCTYMRLCDQKTWICAFAGVVLATLSATPATADVAYLVTVNTSSVSGTSGFLDFQFNGGNTPFQPATAKIESFASVGGVVIGAPSDSGGVSGALPGTVTMTNSAALNEVFQGFKYGSSFSFLVVLSGPALDSPNGTSNSGTTFGLGLYDGMQNPILTDQGNVSGFAGLIDIHVDGSVTTTAFPTANGGPSVVTFTRVAAPGSYQVRYAANLSVGDSVIDLTNTGSAGGFDPGGDICANIYAFDADQHLVSCCACPLTPNHLKTLSFRNDVLTNLLTPGVPNAMTVAVLATTGKTVCDPATVTAAQTVTALRAWGTTIHAQPGGGYGVTETEFSGAFLSPTELEKLTSYCSFIHADGSFFGICQSCQEGAAGAARR